MAISPTYGALLSALIGFGGSALSASGKQNLKSFDGTTADPTKLLTAANSNANGLGSALAEKAREGYQVRTTAQNLPGFAADPAAGDPSLLKFAGLNLPDTIFGGTPKAVPDSPPANEEDKPTRRLRVAPGLGPVGGTSGGNGSEMPVGAPISSASDLFDAIMNPLFYTGRHKKATEPLDVDGGGGR